MKRIISMTLLVLALPETALAALQIFACEPEWRALAQAIGGDRVAVYSATHARQDPHHIEARPSLIAQLRGADLLICSGAELEAGWLPVLLRKARNPAVLPGKPGNLMAADQIEPLEKPASLDRSAGDIHAQGNPHLHLDPRNLLTLGRVLSDRLAGIDPANADFYREREVRFSERLQQSITEWQQRAAPLKGRKVIVHHREWIYLLNWLGLERAGSLEPKPGVAPSTAHLAELREKLEETPVLAVIRRSINDERPSRWLSRQSGTAEVVLPHTVGEMEGSDDLVSLFESILQRLLGIAR